MTTMIVLEDGKYIVSHDNGTNFHALRNGQPWRDLTGDGLVLSMAQEIEEVRRQRDQLLESVTKIAEDLGIINKIPGIISGPQCLVLLDDIKGMAAKSVEPAPSQAAPRPKAT